MRKLSGLPIGVQYYRQPTPVPDEWDGDLAAIKAMGLDFVQLRPQWRWHERNEGELDFSDLDRLFELAEKHGLDVLFKFYLPCAPEWLFDHYDAMRMTPRGEPLPPVTHGAIYVGGFMPCFDKDLVREKATGFVRSAVERYRDRPNLMAWHAWNEPRSAPAADCACDDSIRKYRDWLKRRFGTIEDYNAFAGLAVSGRGDDFNGVKAPVTYNDYIGWLLFRTWRAEMIADRLRWMADLIRSVDPTRPVVSHAGFCSTLQDALEDTSNDYLNAQAFDVYGSSCPNRPDDLPLLETQPTAYAAATVDLICSRLRGTTKPFWINEIYGNRGMYIGPMRPAYLRQTTYHTIAGGAKGVLYWQYRSERLTTESNDAGLVRIDGRPTDRSREVARTTEVLKRHRDAFASAEAPKATVAILYDFASDLISRIETAAPGPVKVDLGDREDYPYKAALRGIHLAFWELDLQVDLVPSEEFERLLDYEVVYLPCPRMISPEQAAILVRYVEGGGLLISEPSPGMRDDNAWVRPHVPPPPLDELFGCREALRVLSLEERSLTAGDEAITCPPNLFLTTLEITGKNASAAGAWDNQETAIVRSVHGDGRAILLGAPLGEIYFRTRRRAVLDWIQATFEAEGVRVENLLETRQEDLRVRRLVGQGDSEILFIFNYRTETARVAIRTRGKQTLTELSDLGLCFEREGGCFVTRLPPDEVLIVQLTP